MDLSKLDFRSLSPGTHLALVFEQPGEHLDTLSDFICAGLERKERVICAARRGEIADVQARLKTRGYEVEQTIAEGHLSFMSPARVYAPNDGFRPRDIVERLTTFWHASLEDGYSGLRVAGGAASPNDNVPGELILEYEFLLNELVTQHPITILCLYDRGTFESDALLGALRTHPVVIIGTEFYDNFYYLPPEELRADGAISTFDRWVASLARYKKLSLELRKHESMLRGIVSSSNDGIVLADSSGVVRQWNPAVEKMSGIDASKAVGSYVWDLIEQVLPEGQRTLEKTDSLRRVILDVVQLRTERWFGQIVEFALPSRNGSTKWAQASLFPVASPDGNYAGAIVRDVTQLRRTEEERRRFEEKLRETQKLESLGLLAGGIAHDFNNLLVGILGNAGLALEDLPAMSPARDAVEDIETAARRAADLARQLLAYSGRGRFIVEPLDLAELVEEMVHLLNASIPKNVIIKLDFVYRPATIKADAVQIRQVVMNLVTNAAEAIGNRSGVITIATGAMNCDSRYLLDTFGASELTPGDYVYLEVSDTGCGMDEATKGRIFDPFFSTKFAGRGLGLAATLGIMRGHQGAIRVYSEPGRGTTFKLLFPASDATLGVKHPPPNPDSSITGTVLIVDDEEWIRAVAKRMLERAGFEVMTAEDGLQGVQVYREKHEEIDLVLLDMTMPHLSGEETFREMRRVRPDVCVILSSGYNEQDAVARFAGRGLAGFIQKPYSPSELVSLIRKTLRTNGKTPENGA